MARMTHVYVKVLQLVEYYLVRFQISWVYIRHQLTATYVPPNAMPRHYTPSS